MSQLEAFVANGNGSGAGCWVPLPITKGDFLKAAATIGASDPSKDSVFLTNVQPELEVLSPHLHPPYDINQLNFFATKLEALSDGQRDIFSACIQAGRHCSGVPEMINLLENLDRIDLQPAFSPKEYGAFQINLARDEFADIMNRLEQSPSPDEQAFFSYIAQVEAHIDLASYGRAQAENENSVFTDYGYLTETAAFREVYRGEQDIPEQFAVSPFAEFQPLLKLEQTDLTDALTKIHDFGGYASDLARNLETLHRRRSSNFLLLLTEERAVLSEAMHIYRAGTPAHDTFVNAEEAKIFSIYVSDFQTDFIGDIREVDAAARRADILENSIHFVDVKAVTMENESVVFTPEQWENVSAKERDSLDSWVRQFADGDYTKVGRHIEHRCDADGFWAQTARSDKFFQKLANNSPAKTEHTSETRPKSVLQQIAAARAQRTEPPTPKAPKHCTEPKR